MAIDFYYGSGSPFAWRVWLALEHKALPYELKVMSFDSGDLEKFFQRCVAATRADELGKNRIAFGPLAINQPMGGLMLPLLARVLGKDAAKFAKENP